ncbi:unnamed protein product, partial [Arabidopsis halleri]
YIPRKSRHCRLSRTSRRIDHEEDAPLCTFGLYHR